MTPLLSCLRAADMWNEAVSLGIDVAHAGWNAVVGRSRAGVGRAALVVRRAADRGALRARVFRASMAWV